jgi:LysR family glycine cleavage system transcriptional activator
VAAPGLVADKRVACPDDLADLPWLQEFGTTESSDWLRRRGVTRERAGGLVQVPGNLLLDGLRNGQGVAVTVREWVRQDITSGRLRLLFEDETEAGYHIVTRPGVLRPPARAFVTWLRRQARRTVPRNQLPATGGDAK